MIKPLTIEDLLRIRAELREKFPPMPKASDGQCKGCGKIIGKQFGGLIDIPAIPIHVGPAGLGGMPMGKPACYVCPECLEAMKKIAPTR